MQEILFKYEKLHSSTRKKILKKFIGLKCFLSGNKEVLDAEGGKHLVSCVYYNDNKYYIHQLPKSEAKNAKFIKVEYNNKELYFTYEELFSEDGDLSLIAQFMPIEEIDTNRNTKNLFLSNYKNTLKENHNVYQFLLGTGVSSEYGVGSWADLIQNMERYLKNSYYQLDVETMKEFFGNIYGLPQMLKDFNPNFYHACIHSSLYGIKEFNPNAKTTLDAIVKVIEKQKSILKRQTVLTFNYDDYLERKLVSDYESEFHGVKEENTNSVTIKHIHGYLPSTYCTKKDDSNLYEDSIILTDEDYNRAYSNNSYTVNSLNKFLDNTTILVGNSVNDYEERKVFRSKFEKSNYTKYHYCLRRKHGTYTDFYINRYLLNCGIVCLWFDEFNDIKEFIYSLSE